MEDAGTHISTALGHNVDGVGGSGGHVVGPPYAELVVGWPGMLAVADYHSIPQIQYQ